MDFFKASPVGGLLSCFYVATRKRSVLLGWVPDSLRLEGTSGHCPVQPEHPELGPELQTQPQQGLSNPNDPGSILVPVRAFSPGVLGGNCYNIPALHSSLAIRSTGQGLQILRPFR